MHGQIWMEMIVLYVKVM